MMGYGRHSSYGQREINRENDGKRNFLRPNKQTFEGVHFTQWSEKATNCHEVMLGIQNHRCLVIQVTQESKANLSLQNKLR